MVTMLKFMRIILALALLPATLAVAAGAWAAGDGSPKRIFLSLDTGGHMALIRQLIFTPDGRNLLSASDDKTIRIWDVQRGLSTAIFRGEIGEGEDGKIYAIALSRDGSLLAASGRTRTAGLATYPIRLLDARNGKVLRLIEGHAEPILSLDFSPDGKTLLSASMDDTAALWNVGSGAMDRRFIGHAGDVNAARFLTDGTGVVTASDDRTIKIWRTEGDDAPLTVAGHEDLVTALAVSPADGTIASGAFDKTVRLWNSADGRPLDEPLKQQGEVHGLAFSADGRLLLSGSTGGDHRPHLWEVGQSRLKLAYGGHDGPVAAVALSPSGKIAATAGGSDNEIHLWRVDDGTLIYRLRGVGRAVWSVGISPDNREIAFGQTPHSGQPNELGTLEHRLRLADEERTLGAPRLIGPEAESFLRVEAQRDSISLAVRAVGPFGYNDTITITDEGRAGAGITRTDADGYTQNAFGLVPGVGEMILGGGHGFVDAWDLQGRKVGDFRGHTGDVWALAISADGRLLVTGSDDQTVRLWNRATRRAIATLFVGRNGEWVMWTEQGYFAASSDGDEHVGWHINQGAEKTARFVTAAQLKQHFYRPDIVARALVLADADRAAQEAHQDGFKLDDLIDKTPPEFTILQPVDGARITGKSIEVRLALADTIRPEGIDVTVAGRRVTVAADPTDGRIRFTVPIIEATSRIGITLRNATGATSHAVTVSRGQGERAGGRLFIVAVGRRRLSGPQAESRFRRQGRAFHRPGDRATNRHLARRDQQHRSRPRWRQRADGGQYREGSGIADAGSAAGHGRALPGRPWHQ